MSKLVLEFDSSEDGLWDKQNIVKVYDDGTYVAQALIGYVISSQWKVVNRELFYMHDDDGNWMKSKSSKFTNTILKWYEEYALGLLEKEVFDEE